MADTRIFRLTRERQVKEPEYVGRQAAGQRYSHYRADRGGKVARVDATNAGATDGWTDVTHEFEARYKAMHPWDD